MLSTGFYSHTGAATRGARPPRSTTPFPSLTLLSKTQQRASAHSFRVHNPAPSEGPTSAIAPTWKDTVAKNDQKRDNGGMYMSAEMLTTLLTGLGILLSFAGAFGWLILRMDSFRTELKDDIG